MVLNMVINMVINPLFLDKNRLRGAGTASPPKVRSHPSPTKGASNSQPSSDHVPPKPTTTNTTTLLSYTQRT